MNQLSKMGVDGTVMGAMVSANAIARIKRAADWPHGRSGHIVFGIIKQKP